MGVPGSEYITPMVFMIVLGTVLLNATTARLFAKLVGVFLKSSDAIMFVGASNAAQLIASYLRDKGKRVILIDSNQHFIQQALDADLEALRVNVYDDDLADNIELNDVGYLLAISGSDAVNQHALQRFSTDFGEHGAYKLATSKELKNASASDREGFFTPNDDYINLSEAFRENPEILTAEIANEKEYETIFKLLSNEEKSIPLFIEKAKGIYLVAEFEKAKLPKENLVLSYLGKSIGDTYKSSSKV